MTKPWVLTAIISAQRDYDGRMWRNEPRTDEIEQRRRTLIQQIRRYKKSETTYIELAERVDNCSPRSLCGSGACPRCAWLFQRWFVKSSRDPIKLLKSSGNRRAITIVPAEGVIAPDRLPDFDATNLNRTFKSRLKNAGVRQAIAGMDISYNVDLDRDTQPAFSIHYYCVASIEKSGGITDEFPSSTVVARPIRTSQFKNTPYRLSYVLKPHFYKRVSAERQKNGRVQKNTDSGKIPAALAPLLALFLDRIGLDSRLLLSGYTIVTAKIPDSRHCTSEIRRKG
jgi:hypothetical protein